MTTATKPRKATDPLSELESLEATVEEHRSDASTYRHQHYEAQRGFAELSEQRRRAFHDRPDEFEVDGTPRAGTAGAEIDDELEKLGKLDFTAEFTRAENAQRLAEKELAVHRFEFAEEIAVELAERGDALAAALNASREAFSDACGNLQDHTGRYATFVGSLPGAINGRDIKSDARVDSIAKTIKHLDVDGEIVGPYSASLAPRGNWAGQPPYVLGPDGNGYINAGNAR